MPHFSVCIYAIYVTSDFDEILRYGFTVADLASLIIFIEISHYATPSDILHLSLARSYQILGGLGVRIILMILGGAVAMIIFMWLRHLLSACSVVIKDFLGKKLRFRTKVSRTFEFFKTMLHHIAHSEYDMPYTVCDVNFFPSKVLIEM